MNVEKQEEDMDKVKAATPAEASGVSVKEFLDACFEAGRELLTEVREDVGGSVSDRDILVPGGYADTIAAYARGIDVLARWQQEPLLVMEALDETVKARDGWDPGLLRGLVRSAAVNIALAERRLSERSAAAEAHNAREALNEAWDVEVKATPGRKPSETELYAESCLRKAVSDAAELSDALARSPFTYQPEEDERVWKEYGKDHPAETQGVELSGEDIEELCRSAALNFSAVELGDVFDEELKLDIEALVEMRGQKAPANEDREAPLPEEAERNTGEER